VRRSAALFLALAGCAAPPPPAAPEKSVWWAPLATYDERHVAPEALVSRLAVKGILGVVHPRSQGLSVAFERHAEAVELMKSAPFSAHLKLHRIEGGPRPDATLPRTPPDPSRTGWVEVARFRTGSLDPAVVLQALRQALNEVGIVVYGTEPEASSVTVPARHVVRARQSLRAGPLRESLEIVW
jgi:hypothetical protein